VVTVFWYVSQTYIGLLYVGYWSETHPMHPPFFLVAIFEPMGTHQMKFCNTQSTGKLEDYFRPTGPNERFGTAKNGVSPMQKK